MSMTQEAREEVQKLIRQGQKLQAIQYLRDTFGISLAEAKQLVEALEAELSPTPSTESLSLSDDDKHSLEQLLRENKKIEGVKFVRAKLGLGLKESLAVVEEIERLVNPNFVPFKPGCKGNLLKIVALIFSFIGLVMLGIALIFYVLDANILKDENKTEAIVTNLVGSNTRAPILSYTWQGKAYTYQGNVYSSPPAFEINERVMVFVNPAKPEEVIIDTFSERWLVITIFSAIGGVFTFLGIIFLFNSRKF